MNKFNKQVDRNLKGIELEMEGKTEDAINLYEQNIKENFDGNHPYDRLAVIYSKKNLIDDEIRVLEKAVWVFEKLVSKARADREPKLAKFKIRLEKVKSLKTKMPSF